MKHIVQEGESSRDDGDDNSNDDHHNNNAGKPDYPETGSYVHMHISEFRFLSRIRYVFSTYYCMSTEMHVCPHWQIYIASMRGWSDGRTDTYVRFAIVLAGWRTEKAVGRSWSSADFLSLVSWLCIKPARLKQSECIIWCMLCGTTFFWDPHLICRLLSKMNKIKMARFAQSCTFVLFRSAYIASMGAAWRSSIHPSILLGNGEHPAEWNKRVTMINYFETKAKIWHLCTTTTRVWHNKEIKLLDFPWSEALLLLEGENNVSFHLHRTRARTCSVRPGRRPSFIPASDRRCPIL